jgi:hypothetical protein
MDSMPKAITEGESVTFSGIFCGPRVERISLLLYPICDETVDAENPVIKIKAKVTEPTGNGQRFEAKLRAPRGTFDIIVFPVPKGEVSVVALRVHRIKAISACAGRVKQICKRILPGHDIIMTTSIGEPLSYKAFKKVTPRVFDNLKCIYDDILLIEKNYIELVQKISSASDIDNQIWQTLLQLLEELFQQHGLCYLALGPFDQRHLLTFLPPRMWDHGIKPFCDGLISYQSTPNGIPNKFMTMVRDFLFKFGTTAPEFETIWSSMMSQIELFRIYSLSGNTAA